MLRKISSVAIAIMILSCLTVQAKITDKDIDLKKGLVLYMPFDEGAGKSVADTSSNELKGSIEGNAKWVTGKFGQALQLHLYPVPENFLLLRTNERWLL